MWPLPWREEGTSSWAVLVGEVMSQQTPAARVVPSWYVWLERWPTPADLVVAPKDEALRMWGRSGYPRRAFRLRECAERIVEKHDGEVSSDVDTLLALSGIGDYTARAATALVSCACTPVVNINAHRILRRHHQGTYLPGTVRRADMAFVEEFLPLDPTAATKTSVMLMELGATVCRTTPKCEVCPIVTGCAWIAVDRPKPENHEIVAAKRRVRKFEGTDRQIRGLLLDVLRAADSPVEQAALDAVWDDVHQRSRASFSLPNDGLAGRTPDGCFQLPH